MDLLLIFFIFPLALATAHGNGCVLKTSTNDLYEVECDGGLDNLISLVPQYTKVRHEYDPYSGRYRNRDYQRENNHKISLSIKSVDLDSSWSNDHQYMDKNIQKLTIDELSSFPNRIIDFTNLQDVENGDSNVFREMKLNNFLSLNQLQSIIFRKSSIENIISIHSDLKASNVNEIDFSHNLIVSLPNSCFENFPQLTSLNMSHNLIEQIDMRIFEGMTNLLHFDISYNRIKEIGHSFVRLVNVNYLYLNNNMLTKIVEPNFITLNKLQGLNLMFNMINVIEEKSFQNLEDIEWLDLSYNNLTRITKGMFQNNTKLSQFSFAYNPIIKIESNVFHGQNFTNFNFDDIKLKGNIEKNCFVGIFNDVLNLSHSEIESLDSEAFTGLETRVLDLSHNKINNISKTAFKGIKLTKGLNLSNNNLSFIEFNTDDLKSLLVFNVENNHIINISKYSFDNFISLKQINLSCNHILRLDPGIFSKLNKLEVFDISNNYLDNSLKASSFQGLISVKNLQLMNNRFTTIENNTFEGMISLEILNCSHGELTSIGYSAFENTGSLKVIDFSNNLIQDFTINSTSIASLIELRLNDNAINNITEQMRSIEKLNLANNNIVKLKANLFASSTNLTFLDLSANSEIDFEDIFENIPFMSELVLKNIRKPFNFEHISNVSISKLDLSYNYIENVSSVFIYKINGITILNLKSNKISIIEKLSFQNMFTLKNLDLSFNLISFLQPGSFLLLKSLNTLNLHGNSIQAIQFGVLDGLTNLETLNLSRNSIHEFGETILRSTPAIKTLALDDNIIEQFNFKEFTPSVAMTITIGGNPLSCHTIADLKKRNDIFTVTAEVLDYHTENIDGVTCRTNFVFNKSSTVLENKSDNNASISFLVLAKAIDGFRASVENFRETFDKVSINNNHTNKIKVPVQNVYASITNNSDFKTLFSNIASIERLMHNWTNISQTITKPNQTKKEKIVEDKSMTGEEKYDLHENIKNIVDAEKDKMIKELQNHFENLKQNHFKAPEAQVKSVDGSGDSKAILYFVAACLCISVVLSLFSVMDKVYRRRKQSKNDGYRYCSSQPISNVIELQDS